MSEDTFEQVATPRAQARHQEKEPSILDKLRSELEKEVKRPEIHLQVPERPAMVLRFSPNVTQTQIRSWRRNAGEDSKSGLDATKFACFVLANTLTGIFIDGDLVTDDSGIPLIFGDEEIMGMLGVDRVNDAIKAVYVIEPHIEASALAVMEAAGFNDSVDEVDPTKKS